MKFRNKTVFWVLSILTMSILAVVVFGAGIYELLINPRSDLPKQLQLREVVFEKKKIHTFGPGGINRSFSVYEMGEKAAKRVLEGGPDYLRSLPLSLAERVRNKPPRPYKKGGTMIRPWWAPYRQWQPTPMTTEESWLQKRGLKSVDDSKPDLANYYGGGKSEREFVSAIPTAFSSGFDRAISTSGNFYAFGGYRGGSVLVVVPSEKKVYHLFKD